MDTEQIREQLIDCLRQKVKELMSSKDFDDVDKGMIINALRELPMDLTDLIIEFL